MKQLALSAIFAFALAISAQAATIKVTVTTDNGTVLGQGQATLDDASAQAILGTYASVLNADTTTGCGPACTGDQVVQSMAVQFGAQAAAFTRGVLANQAAAAAQAAVPSIAAPH